MAPPDPGSSEQSRELSSQSPQQAEHHWPAQGTDWCLAVYLHQCVISLVISQDIVRQPQLLVTAGPLSSVCHQSGHRQTTPAVGDYRSSFISVSSVRTSSDNPSCWWLQVHFHQCVISLNISQDTVWEPQLSVTVNFHQCIISLVISQNIIRQPSCN